MSVVVVGLEHGQVPLSLLERAVVSDDQIPKVLGRLRRRPNLSESVLVSTCLRTEIYAVVDRFHDAVHELQEVLGDLSGLGAAELEERCRIRFDDDVATHLFSVAAGLESAVPGEPEVLGQVRRAWDRAREEGTSGPVLSGLFRHAVETGKRVRTETAIARGTTSFAHAAVDLAARRTPGALGGAAVVVVGAGQMGAGLVQALVDRRPETRPAAVCVVNRTEERAAEVVGGVDGAGVALDRAPLAGLPDAVAAADVVLVAVGGPGHVLGRGDVSGRPGRPLLVVDLGVPRAVDPAVGDEAGVTLIDLDSLRAAVDQALDDRRAEVTAARAVVDEEVARHRKASRARVAAPVVAALRGRLEERRQMELARRRPAGVDDETWAAVDQASRAVLAKLLHEPTVVLKETAGTPRGERLVEALRTLFDL